VNTVKRINAKGAKQMPGLNLTFIKNPD